MQDQELKFPVEWHYKIIVEAANENVFDGIREVLRAHGVTHDPTAGGQSGGGKYISWRVSVVFNSREQMNQMSAELGGVPGVKFLI